MIIKSTIKKKKIYNVYISLPKKHNKSLKFGKGHSFDFGIKRLKLLIEYDGWYWHHSEKYNTEKRDKYWDKIANLLEFTVFRINSDDWNHVKTKREIIKNLKIIIQKLEKIKKY